ncbi:MAG: lipopolysaccharide biosynthesis protein [Chlorobi bacterium]|nr:lipopolysaccharide biosynthesis protein [Chlorobiota bacterium]
MELKRLSYKHKNNKIKYYLINYLRQLIPVKYYQDKLIERLNDITDCDIIEQRVNYYNKLTNPVELSDAAIKLSDLTLKNVNKTYYFDLYEYSRYFDQDFKAHFLFGDITHVPDEPGLTKSRPISKKNFNSVILKWNKVRHFIFVGKDKKEFSQKKDMLVSRGKVHKSQTHRVKFLEKYFNHPLCNIGKVNDNDLNPEWKVGRMTINEQLEYKFILCLEGNDVASNLKWVMSSNSIAVMPEPKYESWFMEGLLKPDYHYIKIKDDYSDLESRINYYIKHQDEANKIIENAHKFVDQFKNKATEDIISLLVMTKYFEKTKQFSVRKELKEKNLECPERALA